MLDKALITRADDFGSSHSANQAIYEVSKKGIVKNVSVMACAPYLEEAAEMLASSKDVTFGMHSVINAEWDRVVWGPVAPKEKVKSLIDHRGVFYQDVLELAAAKPLTEGEIVLSFRQGCALPPPSSEGGLRRCAANLLLSRFEGVVLSYCADF